MMYRQTSDEKILNLYICRCISIKHTCFVRDKVVLFEKVSMEIGVFVTFLYFTCKRAFLILCFKATQRISYKRFHENFWFWKGLSRVKIDTRTTKEIAKQGDNSHATNFKITRHAQKVNINAALCPPKKCTGEFWQGIYLQVNN